ncbi:MAG: hypothetical protein C3F15_09165, partial [Holophagae bacterium]
MWLPEIIRSAPSAPLVLRWMTTAEEAPAQPDEILSEEVRRSGARLVDTSAGRCEVLLPWQTLVYGLIRREVDEQVALELVQEPEGWQLRVSCLPIETHAAHAAGAGGVALMAAAAWVIGGWTGGLLPSLATALAGGLWADATRNVALQRLE